MILSLMNPPLKRCRMLLHLRRTSLLMHSCRLCRSLMRSCLNHRLQTFLPPKFLQMNRLLRRPPRLLINLYKPAIAAALMGGVAFLVNRLCLALELPLLVRTAGSILVAGAVYVGLVLVLRIITADDCRLLPKGDKIARLLRIQ